MSSGEQSDRHGTPALETVREEVDALADPAGTFVVRCGRTGQRPVPADEHRFPDREAAARAALLTTEYRTRLRFWDDRTPYCDPIAHEEPGGECPCGRGGGRYPPSPGGRIQRGAEDGARAGDAGRHGSSNGGDCDENAAEE